MLTMIFYYLVNALLVKRQPCQFMEKSIIYCHYTDSLPEKTNATKILPKLALLAIKTENFEL